MKRTTGKLVTAVAFFVLILSAGSGWSQERPRDACKDDVAKYCKDVPQGGGRIIKCLMEHSREVSPKCRVALKKVESRFGAGAGKSAPGGEGGGK